MHRKTGYGRSAPRRRRCNRRAFGSQVVGVLAAAAAICALTGAANAADRFALVIGNSGYAAFSELPNPRNDASDMGATLERLGFEVSTLVDGGRVQMHDALQRFARRSVGAAVAVIFYAGHGMEMDGVNYLIPVDARLERDTDVEYETVPLDRVLRATEGAALRLVILDACRDNPLAQRMQRARATRSISRGSFGDLDEQQLLDETLVAYAAAAGTTAADGDGRNSPYTAALLAHLEQPLEVSALFRRVRRQVLETTQGRQRPHEYQSLLGDHYLTRGGIATDSTPEVEERDTPDAALGAARGRRGPVRRQPSPVRLSRGEARPVSVRLAVSSPANPSLTIGNRLEGEVRALLLAQGFDVAATPGREAGVRIEGAVELSDAGDVSGTGLLTATAVVTLQVVDVDTGAVLAAAVARSRAAGVSQGDARDRAGSSAVGDALAELVGVLR